MSRSLLLFLLGQVTLLSGAAMLVPFFYSLGRMTAEVPAFLASLLLVMTAGELLAHFGKHHPPRMELLDAAALLVFGWPLAALSGAVPFVLSGALGPVDALFESVSALTSTGISVLPVNAPYALQLWRSIIAWLGSLSFVVMLVTVMPAVCGSFGLVLSYEHSLSFSPLLVRMRRSAFQAVRIYVGLTGVSLVLFYLAGLGPIDALSLAMMSLSTGGGADLPVFMLRDNPWLELAAILSMLLACGNFLLYRQALRRRDFRLIWQDTELHLFFLLLLLFGLVVSGHLWYAGVYDLADSLRYGFFEVVSFSSTSGFMAAPVAAWPDFDRFLLLLLVFVGGCIGSLTGGLKIKRFVILFRMTLSEMKRTLHPHMVERIRVGKETVSMRIVGNILCYFFLHFAVFYVFTALLSLSDITLPEAVGLGVGMLSSVGTASGLYGFDTYANLAPGFKLLCCFFMLVGRMEIFTLLLWLGGRTAADHRW
ncbi:MAG: TrkH family potassium uptake protein [Schwartzia sp. (in: firmicutes)]